MALKSCEIIALITAVLTLGKRVQRERAADEYVPLTPMPAIGGTKEYPCSGGAGDGIVSRGGAAAERLLAWGSLPTISCIISWSSLFDLHRALNSLAEMGTLEWDMVGGGAGGAGDALVNQLSESLGGCKGMHKDNGLDLIKDAQYSIT